MIRGGTNPERTTTNHNVLADFCHESRFTAFHSKKTTTKKQDGLTRALPPFLVLLPYFSAIGEVRFQISSNDISKVALDIETAVMQQKIFTGRQILHNNVDFSTGQ